MAARWTFPMLAAAFWLAGAAAAQEQAAVDAGARLYAERCSECHGARLRNTGGTFDLRTLREEERSRFEQGVLDGKGQMPPWRGILGEGQIAELWAYIRAYAYE